MYDGRGSGAAQRMWGQHWLWNVRSENKKCDCENAIQYGKLGDCPRENFPMLEHILDIFTMLLKQAKIVVDCSIRVS